MKKSYYWVLIFHFPPIELRLLSWSIHTPMQSHSFSLNAMYIMVTYSPLLPWPLPTIPQSESQHLFQRDFFFCLCSDLAKELKVGQLQIEWLVVSVLRPAVSVEGWWNWPVTWDYEKIPAQPLPAPSPLLKSHPRGRSVPVSHEGHRFSSAL